MEGVKQQEDGWMEGKGRLFFSFSFHNYICRWCLWGCAGHSLPGSTQRGLFNVKCWYLHQQGSDAGATKTTGGSQLLGSASWGVKSKASRQRPQINLQLRPSLGSVCRTERFLWAIASSHLLNFQQGNRPRSLWPRGISCFWLPSADEAAEFNPCGSGPSWNYMQAWFGQKLLHF